MGVLHGVAGSSHFFGVLPALALPSAGAALMYIGAFGVGTVAAMTAFAAAVGLLGVHTSSNARLHRAMMSVAAALAMLIGGVWLIAPHVRLKPDTTVDEAAGVHRGIVEDERLARLRAAIPWIRRSVAFLAVRIADRNI